MRRGAGRVKHIATPTLWLQRLVINGDIKMTRVGGNDNCTDLGTKHLDYQTMNRHLKCCGTQLAEGQSKIAPHLEFFSTWIPMSDETSGSPHSASPRHEQRLEQATRNFGMVTLSERLELQLALDSDFARKGKKIRTESDACVSSSVLVEFCHLAMCGSLPSCQEGAAGCRL